MSMCRGRFIIMVAIACIGMATSALAQGRDRSPSTHGDQGARGGRSVDVDYALLPSFSTVDLQLIIDRLELDEGQSLVVETLLEDYLTRFSEESQGVRVQLQDARPGSIKGETLEGMQRGRTAMELQAEQMRKELSDRIRTAETSEERTRIREEFTRQMAEFMKQQEAVVGITGDTDQWSDFLLEQAEILRAWNESRRELETEFVGAIELVLDPDQVEPWRQARAAIRRRLESPRGRLEGERLDMAARYDQFVPEGELRDMLRPTIEAYEVELEVALLTRHEFMLEVGPVLSEVLRSGDWPRMQSIIEEEAVIRTRVRDLHVTTLDVLANVLPEPQRGQLMQEVHRQFNSSIWSKGRFERAIDAAAARDDVTDSERTRLEAIRASCMTGIDEIRTQQDALARTQAPTRWIHEETRVWSSSFPDAQFDSSLDNKGILELKRARQEAEENCMLRLKELLGEERYKSIPGARSKPDRGTGGRQRGEAAAEAQRRRDELYKRFDLDGNGSLDTEERRRMRDELMREQRGGRGRP